MCIDALWRVCREAGPGRVEAIPGLPSLVGGYLVWWELNVKVSLIGVHSRARSRGLKTLHCLPACCGFGMADPWKGDSGFAFSRVHLRLVASS